MSVLKYLISLWVVIIVYSLLSLFAGARGFSAYDQLKKERERQRTNLENLQNINHRLEGDKNALLYDSDTLTVYARELGYGAETERLVRIVGLSRGRKQDYTAGQILSVANQVYLSNQAIRLISLFVGLGVLGLLFLTRLLEERNP